jgi:4-hydroxy-3-polyprenylbenzoate decarboxylase
MFNDLRDFINEVQSSGECTTIEEADTDLEVGAVSTLFSELPEPPLLLFNKLKGFQPGFRVATNLFTTNGRTALALGLPKGLCGVDLVRAYRDKLKAGFKPLPPVEVRSGPVLDNIDTGGQINLLKFPAPKWNELDGGRYIGTGTCCITRDPEQGWVNAGTYRIQVQDERNVTVQVVKGHHGDIIRQRWWNQGKNCPIAICCGQAPALFSAASAEGTPWGMSELDVAGGIKGSPVEVIKGPYTGLPIPASAEIVLECDWCPPEDGTRMEGPFGEFHGYYASGARLLPIAKVKNVLYRNDPIIQGNPPSMRPAVWTLGRHIQKAAALWEELDRQITGVKGVYMMEDATIHAMPVISLEQQYSGHAMRAALLAAGLGATAFESSVIMVVDEDINPANRSEVIWALGTRTNQDSFITIPGCWGIQEDSMVSPEMRRLGNYEKSRTAILAVKPFHWRNDFPPSIRMSPELRRKTLDKWGKTIFAK